MLIALMSLLTAGRAEAQSQTIVFSPPVSPLSYSTGLAIPLLATGGGSGNPVVLSVDAASTATGTIAGNILSVTSAGVFVIDANQAGSGSWTAAAQEQRELQINASTQTISFTPPTTPVNYSNGLTATLSATGGSSGNPIVFSIDPSSTGTGTITGNTLAVTGAGTFVIDANQAAAAGYLAATQVQRTYKVSAANQSINFTQPASPQTFTSGMTVNLTATGGASGNPVVFSVDAASTGTGTIVGNVLTVTGAGSIVVDANQAGNANFNAAAQIQREIDFNEGTGLASLSPSSLSLGNVALSEVSALHTVTLKNSGTGTITINSISVFPAPYEVDPSSTCLVPTLAKNATCTINVAANSPVTLGALPLGTLTVNTTATNPEISIQLYGTVVAPVALTSSLNFGNEVVSTTSAAKSVTLTNNQAATLNIGSITAPAPYAVTTGTNACGATLASGVSCQIWLTFAPTGPGSMPASLSVGDDGPTTPQTSALSGTGLAATTMSATSVAFGSVLLSSTSPIKTVTFTNNQSTSVTFSTLNLSGDTQFARDPSSTCSTATPVAPTSTCTLAFTFTPTATGTQPNGTLTITDNAPSSPLTITLTGTGLANTILSPGSTSFSSVVINSTSAVKTLTLTNNNTSPLLITQAAINGPFALVTNPAFANACPIFGGTVNADLAAQSNCVIGLTFNPTTGGATTGGKITIVDSDPSGPVSAALSGTGVAADTLTMSLGFGSVVVNSTSTKSATFTNHLGVPVTFTSISAPAPYSVTTGTNACSTATPLASNSSCQIWVSFAPTTLTSTPATLTVDDNGPTSPQTTSLSGSGIAPATLSPSPLNFGYVIQNQTTAKTVTLTNNQSTPLTIGTITGLTGAFSAGTSTCTATLAAAPGPGNSCTIAVNLKAVTSGSQSGTLTVATNAPAPYNSLADNLTGSADPPVVVSPGTVSFPTTFVGVASSPLLVKVYNEQSTTLTISAVQIAGTDPNDYNVVSSCPTSPSTIPAAAVVPNTVYCTLSVTFKPIASGTRTATLQITDSASNSPQTVSLTGPGNAPVLLSPTTANFGNVHVGSISGYETFTITNAQTATTLHISSFQFSGDFAQTSTDCGTGALPYALAPTASCHVTVSFSPTVGGVRDGQLQLYDDALTSPQIINFQGTGTYPLTTSPTGLSFSAQTVNTTSASKLITLTNHENKPETFTVAASGDYSATTSCVSGSIAASGTCAIFVKFTPSATTPSTRTGVLTIADSAAIGSPVTASLTGSAIATPPQAAVAVVSPGAGAAGTQVPVVITGNGWTHFSSSSVISFLDTNGGGIAPDITVVPGTQVLVGPNQINATLQLASGAGVVYGARNIWVKTPLSGGGLEQATLYAGFNLMDPTQAYQITSVTPAIGTQGQTLNVAITASGTHFVQGTTIANFGDGITVDQLTITGSSGTTANATITISNTTPVGYRTVTMVTGGEYAVTPLVNGNPYFQIVANSAALTGVTEYTGTEPTGTCTSTPVVDAQGAVDQICLTGTGTHFLNGATTATINGVIVGAVNVISPTQAVAQVAVPANAPIGPQNVTVSTGGEIETLAGSFDITGATPGLVSVTPNTGQQGKTLNVIITGNSYTTFNACPGGVLTANFTGEITTNSVVANSATQVTANITVHQTANVGGITATLTCGAEGEATLFPFGFSVTASAASIVSVTPNSIPQGGQVTVAVVGLNTIWNQATTTAGFYPETGAPSIPVITINSATSALLNISVSKTTPPGNYPFWMRTGGQIVSSSINVYANTPTLTMSPSNGLLPSGSTPSSFTVNFTGQFTQWTQAGTVPVVAGSGVTLSGFTVVNPSLATATLSIAPGTVTGSPNNPHLITLTTGSEVETTYFNVTTTPVYIQSVTPWHGPQSTTMNVAIVGVNTHFTPSVTQVQFGPQITVNSVTVTDATHLTANITTSYLLSAVTTPTPPGWQNIYVNTNAEQVIAGFLVDAPLSPSLTSVCLTGDLPTCVSSAQQGAGGLAVTITGNLTKWDNTSELILGAGITVSNLTITSPTTATADLSVSPTAPVGGNSVIMITEDTGEIDSGVGFSVTPSAASISLVEPNFTCSNQVFTEAVNAVCGNGGAPTGVPVIGQLQTVTLNVTGVGTHWLQGETTMSFGYGVNIDKLTINSPTSATVQITVLSSSPIGFATATSYTDGETASLQQAIDIESGSPAMLAISPGAGEQDATFTMEILGRFTHFTQGTTVVSFNNPDLSMVPNSIHVLDSQTMTVGVTINPLAYVDTGWPCGHVVYVTTGSEQVESDEVAASGGGYTTDNFCVQQGAEQINSVSPLETPQGSTTVLTITGAATNFEQGVSVVNFGDPNFVAGPPTVTSATTLTVPVAVATSATTGFKTVTVTTLGQVATQQYSFIVEPTVATLNEAEPNQDQQGAQGMLVKLIGQYSHFTSESTATFGAGITVTNVAYVSPTEVDATINIDPLSYTGGRTVTVTTPNVSCSYQPVNEVAGLTYQGCTPGVTSGVGSEIVTNNIFSIVTGPAIIQGISPATGNEGQEIVFNITGLDTHWAQNFTQFYIAGGGSDITVHAVIINSPTSATVDMTISPTANPGARSIYMVTNGESLTDNGAFVVTGGIPVVTSVSPNSALQGTTGLEVTVTGNAYTQWVAGVTTVSFGPGVTVNSFQVDDASHIEAVLNIDPAAQVGYRTVVVQTGAQGLTGYFQVTAPAPPPQPYIWYENPSSGIPGQTLTISFGGANTHWDPNPTTGTQLTGFDTNVTINSFQVTSPTSALANITISPAAVQHTYDLTLTTNSASPQEVDSTGFSVVVAQPTLTIVDPGSGLQGAQDITVNIIGQFTAFDATTTFTFGNGIQVNGAPTILGPTIATQSISIPQLQPTGGYAVVAHTPDATAGNQVTVGGAYFSVTPSLAHIISISPNIAPQGSTITVDVQGQFTHWSGATTFQFGAGIVVTSYTVNSPTDATVTLAIPALASEGPTGASATTGGEVASITNGFVVEAGTPLLLSSGPWSLPQQSSAIFTILSQATNWTGATPPVVSYGAGVILTNVNVTSPTTMTVTGAVQPTTPVGYRNLTVTSGTQVLTLANAFYVAPGPAVINSVTANNAGQGATLSVTINGTNTHWQQGVTTLAFPYVVINSLTVNTATSMTANITVQTTAPAGEVSLTATTLGEVATGINVFTINQTQPELLAAVVTPGTCVPTLTNCTTEQGETLTINLTGQFTHFSNSSVPVFGTGITVNSVSATSATQLAVSITISPTTTIGTRDISVTTGAEVVTLNNNFTVQTGPAAIQNLNPATGAQGTTLTVHVTGSQTHFAQGVTTAIFGGGIQVNSITVNDLLHADVTVQIPNNISLTSYSVTLTTGGEVAFINGGFTVASGAPVISLVNPATGTQGASSLNVQLTGLFTHWVNGTSIANFGSGITVNSLLVTDSTDATANITISPTAAISSRTVTVTTGAETASITGGFSVLAGVPALLTVLPGTAQAGTTDNIVITGQFTTFQQGFSSVSAGSGVTVNFVTVNSLTQLTANITVASNASVGLRDVSVTTNSATQTLHGALSITAGTPVITQISPNIGNPGQTLNVTLTGQYTNWVSGTTTANFGAGITVNSVTVNSPTSVTVNITIGSGTPVGPVTVTTTTGGEMETVAGGFTVQAASIPAPSLLSVSPGTAAGGVPINSIFTFVFSQPMNRTTITTSTVEMWLISNQGQGWITVTGTVSVDATGRIATFTPNSLLAVNSQYYVLLTNGIKDATGNTFPQWGYQSFYTADSANVTAPTVTAANPPANDASVGTNVTIQLQFSTDMNQLMASGLTVSTGGNPIAGSYSWNANPYCCGTGWAGPGTILTFTPTAALQPNTVYTVAWANTMTDTAGNALTPGTFNFKTGSGPDTAYNYSGPDFTNYITNVSTNFIPKMNFTKPINPLDINNGTLLLYNADSNKYIQGTVTLAPNGLSATFTPEFALLPDTYYRFYQAGGNYDSNGNYMYGENAYFTTGLSQATTAPTVVSSTVQPANGATGVPLNTDVWLQFNTPVDPDSVTNAVTLTPTGGGSAIAGTASLASDQVSLTFAPTTGALQPATQYTVNVSGFTDVAGNSGTPYSSTFTTAASIAPLNVSTGVNASGQAILVGDTVDPHWTVYKTVSIPSGESSIQYPGTSPLYTVASGEADWYGGWDANGPNSSWIAINPLSAQGNSAGFYSTPFTLPGSLPAYHLCLVGAMSHDDSGLLAVNGQPIMADSAYTGGSLVPLNIDITSFVTTGTNYLSFAFGNTDNSLEGLRLQGVVEACGASVAGGLSLQSMTPASGASGVSTATNIVMTFNNAVVPLTVNSTTLPVMVSFNSNQEIAGNYVVSGSTVTFTPNTPFPTSTTIYIGACNGPYDQAGDTAAVNGCYTNLANFTTGSTATPAGTPFQITAFTPTNGTTNVGLRAPVAATFNRSVNLGSVNSSDFALFNGDGQSPWCTSVTHSQDDATILFNCGVMPSSANMTAFLGAGIKDWQGNTINNFNSAFTTTTYDSNTNGSVNNTLPSSGAGGVGVNQPITFILNYPVLSSTVNAGIEVAENNANIPGSFQVLDNGYIVVFTPSSPWTPGALVQWWTTGSLLDATYQTPFNSVSGYFYVAASTSALAPTIQTTSPPSGTNPAALNSVFDTQFNTPINGSTITATNIYLYDGNTGLNPTVTYSQPQPNVVRMAPSSPLTAGHVYYIYVKPGLQSTTSVAATSTYWYVYTTAGVNDSTTPTVTNAVPYNGASSVGVNVWPGVVFSKPIDQTTVTSSTFQILNGATPLTGNFWFNSNNTRVEFVPFDALPANTTLTMSINGVQDQEGHPASYSSTFQTGSGPEISAPYVVSTSITSNGSVPTNSSITVQFSASMDITSFGQSVPGSCRNIYIYDNLVGTCINATLQWSSDQRTAYLVPAQPLAADRQYTLYVNGGSDIAGNTMSGYGNSFYAEVSSASTAPTVTAFNPLPSATGVGTNVQIVAMFSGPIDPTTLSGVTLTTGGNPVPASPQLSAGNTVLQVVPAAALAPSTTYELTIAGVKDPAGNVVATVTNSFTTGATYDNSALAVVSTNPVNNATVGTNVAPEITFSKPLNPDTVSNSTFQMYLNDTSEFIPLTVTLSADHTKVTLTPVIALQAETKYRYSGGWNNGPQDQDGNFLNLSWYYFTTSGGSVTTGPTVSVSPSNGATGIPLNAQVIAMVSASVDPITVGQNAIQVLNGSTPVAGTVTLVNAQQINFAPSANLAAGTTYTVQVNNFNDANENPVVPYSGTFTTGTAVSAGGLTFSGANITWGATGVSTTAPIVLTFSQPLDPTTVNGNTLPVMDGWNSNYPLAGTYTVNGNQVTFTPSNPYPLSTNPSSPTTIYVGECGGPTDVLGDVFQSGNCYSQQLVYFSVAENLPDTTALQVLSVSPAANATGVTPDTQISVTFNKSINPYSVFNNGNNALLYAGESLLDRGSITMSADDRVLTFNTGALAANTTFTVELPAGGISDPSGNTLTTTYTSTFTTGANPASGNTNIVSSWPSGGATSVPTNTLLTIWTSRPVNASTLPGSVVVTVNGAVYPASSLVALAGGYEIQYTPATPFPAGATVQWFLSGVLDTSGNAINGTSNVFYTAATVNAATAEPLIVSVSPSANSNTMPTNGEVDIQYSQPINGATVTKANIYPNAGISDPNYSVALISPTVVRISPPAGGWTPSASAGNNYYGFCSNSNVQGTNGVNAQSACWLTYFYPTSVDDTTPGTVTVGPPNNSTTVGTNAYIRFQFSKPADRSTINTSNILITTGGNPIPGSFSYSYGNNGNADLLGVNFQPLNPLPASSVISIVTNNILDYAGNTFTPTNTQFTTLPTPDYSTPNVTLDFGGGATGIGTNASFTCLYSEPMDPSSVNNGNTYVYSYVTNARIPVTYTWAPDLMAVTMTPVTPLWANSSYYYECSGAISLTGNGESNGSSSFTTAGGAVTQGPQLINANPPSGMTNVPLNTIYGPWNSTSLQLQFNVPVSTESLSNITLTPGGGSPLPIGVTPEWGNTIAVINLPWTLSANTTYTFNVAGVTDLNGNAATGTTTSSFTTGSGFDWNNPGVASALPANSTTGVATSGATISVTFNEVMDPVLFDSSHVYLRNHNTSVTIPTTFAITNTATTTTVTVTPTVTLAGSTIFDLVVNNPNWCLTDVAGNNINNCGSQVATSFTTVASVAVNGACGSANTGTTSTPPTTGLCSAGTATSLNNAAGNFTWTCTGSNGGSNASCSSTVTPAAACVVQSTLPTIAGWWKADGDATDHSGNGNTGTLENGAGFALGLVNDAFTLSGSNQYVLIGDPVPANLQLQNHITLQAWIYPTAYPTDYGSGAMGMILGSQDDGVYGGTTLFFDGRVNPDGYNGIPTGHIQFQIGSGTTWYTTDTETQVPLNQWTLVTATRDANGQPFVYYDGVSQPLQTVSSAWNGTISYPASDWFAIGQEVNENRPFTGLIDEAMIFNTSLTPTQIQSVYNAGNAGVCP
jgi:hypothetical protein